MFDGQHDSQASVGGPAQGDDALYVGGVIDFAHICGSESMMAQIALVLNSTQILVTRSYLPMYVPSATHNGLSLKNDDVIIIHTHHLCRTILT